MSAPPRAQPNTSTAVATFVAGIFLGLGLLAPIVPSIIDALPKTTTLGSIGAVLLLGVLAMIMFVLGLATLYIGFLVFEG